MLAVGCRKAWLAGLAVIISAALSSCARDSPEASAAAPATPEVGVVKVVKIPLGRSLTVSSELVPFQQIDVYAKESGFVQQLNVDYGSRVKKGDVMAVLEIPELQDTLTEDQAEIRDARSQVDRTQEELSRVQAQQNVTHLEYTRLNGVAKSQPGLVAQQEVDDREGTDLAAQAQVAATKASLQSAQSQLQRAQAKLKHDQALYDYASITAPFDGVVTERYANYGTLMQSGINSSTQALPLVQLSEDDLFRLVIPVPESYVPSIHIGDAVEVQVPALHRTFPGNVTRFSVDVAYDTRTMHTEVDVPNPQRILVPGEYAEATLKIDQTGPVIAVPPEAVNIEGDMRSVWVVTPSGKAEKRTITLGVETPNDIQVLSGVSAGEMVAVGDRSSLRPGETVKPKVVQLVRTTENGSGQ